MMRMFVWPLKSKEQTLNQKVARLWGVEYGSWDEKIHSMHADMAKAVVDKKQLLVWNVDQGWPRLCEFLKVKVPDIPFPVHL